MSKRVAVFNHKGGVSKTTSVYNIGWKLAELGKRVLLVDADPQCNLTSLILGDDFDRYYLDEETKSNNLKDGVKVAFEGKPTPITHVNCKSPVRNGNVFLLAGHQNLSEYDAALTFAQTSNNAITTLQNLPGAFSELLRLTEDQYNIEITLIDMNPSLSAINQNLFISSNAFIIPTNPDPFSVMAIDTLKVVLPKWVAWAKSMGPVFNDSAYPMPNVTPKFMGELIQRFNIRRGVAARPYRDNIGEIKATIMDRLIPAMTTQGMIFSQAEYEVSAIPDDFCLAEIADFQGLLPKAHGVGVPVFALTNPEINETGPVLTQMAGKRDEFNQQFTDIATKIQTLIQYA